MLIVLLRAFFVYYALRCGFGLITMRCFAVAFGFADCF